MVYLLSNYPKSRGNVLTDVTDDAFEEEDFNYSNENPATAMYLINPLEVTTGCRISARKLWPRCLEWIFLGWGISSQLSVVAPIRVRMVCFSINFSAADPETIGFLDLKLTPK